MADEVTYARIVVRGLTIYGIDANGNETELYSSDILPRVYERADYYAGLSGVIFEIEEPTE